MLRNRMLADPNFLFKIGTEVCIYTLLAALVGYARNLLRVDKIYVCVCLCGKLLARFWTHLLVML